MWYSAPSTASRESTVPTAVMKTKCLSLDRPVVGPSENGRDNLSQRFFQVSLVNFTVWENISRFVETPGRKLNEITAAYPSWVDTYFAVLQYKIYTTLCHCSAYTIYTVYYAL
jgi:hypothetical protein